MLVLAFTVYGKREILDMNIGKQAVTAEECNTTYCFCIECSPFYWKDLDAKSATVVLSQLPAGSFLVRPSRHPAFKYTLSQVTRFSLSWILTHCVIKIPAFKGER